MNKDIKELTLDLQKKLETSTSILPNVTSKKLFGCYALWVNENVSLAPFK